MSNEIQGEYGLKCTNCGKAIEYQEVIAVAKSQYIILLFGNLDEDMCGIYCPYCSKVFANRVSKTFQNKLIDDIQSPWPQDKLYYDSTPLYDNLELMNRDDYFHINYSSPMQSPEPVWLHLQGPSAPPEEYFCSYEKEIDYLSDQISVFWYMSDQIDSLIEKENSTKIKQLPRYIYYDEIWTRLEEYTWCFSIEERKIDFFKNQTEYSPIAQIVLVGSPFQHEVKRRYEFINIVSGVLNSIELQQVMDLSKPPLEEYVDGAKEIQLDNISVESSFDYLWNNFENGNIKNILNTLSTGIIYDYITTKSDIKSNHDVVKSLIYDYVYQLVDSTIHIMDGKIARHEIPEQLQKEIDEIESNYPSFKDIVTQNQHMMELKVKIAKKAMRINPIRPDFLLLGHPGVGKELFAKAIHEVSKFSGRDGALISENCSGMPKDLVETTIFGYTKGAYTGAAKTTEGLVEAASNGTFFLDEIGDLPIEQQPKFLRLVEQREVKKIGSTENKPVDVRFIFATNRNLKQMVSENNFRRDLYERINWNVYKLPSLNERRDDIPILADHFLNKYDMDFKQGKSQTRIEIDQEALHYLCNYDWETGVRDFERTIYRAMDDTGVLYNRRNISIDDIINVISGEDKLDSLYDTYDRTIIKGIDKKKKVFDEDIKYYMAKYNGNKSAVARELCCDRKTITRRCKELAYIYP